MIKILYIIPNIDCGGVGTVVFNYISHMDLTGMQIDIVTQDFGEEQFFAKKYEDAGTNVFYVTRRKNNIKKHFHGIEEVIKRGNYDVVHSHDQNWSVFYLLLAKKYGVKKRIGHSHLTMQTNDRWKIKVLNLLNPVLKNTATGYFACGKEAGIYMWGKKIGTGKQLYVMNNGIDTEMYKFDQVQRKKCREKLKIDGKTVLGHVGRFSKQKNHVFLIEIFEAYLKINCEAVLMLIGEGELEDDVKSLVQDKGLANHVLFLGQRDDVYELMNAMDIFLLPSLYEGLPVVGVEAQANGLPCFFADSVTEEVKLLPSTKFVSLNESPDEWAMRIDKYNGISDYEKRKMSYEIAQKKGYDITVESEKLKKYYQM